MSSSVSSPNTGTAFWYRVGRLIFRNSLLFGFGAVFVFLAFAAPGFLSWNNLVSVLLNEFTLAAIVSLGMTVVISAGGIDLSVGSAVDIASLVFISSIAANLTFRVALIGRLGGALAGVAAHASVGRAAGVPPRCG